MYEFTRSNISEDLDGYKLRYIAERVICGDAGAMKMQVPNTPIVNWDGNWVPCMVY